MNQEKTKRQTPSRQETIRRRRSKGSILQWEDHISRSCRLRFHCKEWIVELADATDKNSCVVYFDFPGSVDAVMNRSRVEPWSPYHFSAKVFFFDLF
jgi:hypothetical protein